MQIPETLLAFRSSLGFDRIEYGTGGVYLYRIDELTGAQVGYGVSSGGASLCGKRSGDWRESWIVIGHDLALGDPLFVDVSISGIPVLTAMHGEGTWEPIQISSSLEHYRSALTHFAEIAQGRENTVRIGQNPLSAKARKAAVRELCGSDPDADKAYWESVLSEGE
jgi:hypothetical protein